MVFQAFAANSDRRSSKILSLASFMSPCVYVIVPHSTSPFLSLVLAYRISPVLLCAFRSEFYSNPFDCRPPYVLKAATSAFSSHHSASVLAVPYWLIVILSSLQ